MHLEVTQPDGSIEYVTPTDIARARIFASFNEELAWLLSALDNLTPGKSLQHGGRIWKRVN